MFIDPAILEEEAQARIEVEDEEAEDYWDRGGWAGGFGTFNCWIPRVNKDLCWRNRIGEF
jgi:hypothetical protein